MMSNKADQASPEDNEPAASEDATAVEASGIIKHRIPEEALEGFDWEGELRDHDWTVHRHGAVLAVRERARALEEQGELAKAGLLQLLAAVISMHLTGATSKPFTAFIQNGNNCTAMPEHLDQQDVQFLHKMAENCSSSWLRARIADVACVAGPDLGIPGWRIGQVAAQAYLEEAKKFIDGSVPVRAMDAVKYLQRALQLGWVYSKKDVVFQADLWTTIQSAFDVAIEKRFLGILFPLAEEIIQRRPDLASSNAKKLEDLAELWCSDPDPSAMDFASRAFNHAARLWNTAKNDARSKACYFKSGEALITKSRQPGQAMVRAEWMSEGIAILRRHGGDRDAIRQLQIELADVRQAIHEEMHVISHPIDVKDLVEDIDKRVDADTFPRALLQVAFAFSQFSSAEAIRQEVIESNEKYVFQHLFARVTYNGDGVPVVRSAPLDINDEESMERHMVQSLCEFHHPLLADVAIVHAINIVRHRFEPSLNEVMAIVSESPCVPEGHRWTLSRGLLAGLDHNWHEAAVFLIPQAEPFIRAAFKRCNVSTVSVEEHGEEEKSLTKLLDHPEVSKVLFPDLVLELKAILTHKAGHNLRNRYGHGLMKDSELASTATIVLWWTILRLILWPYRNLLLEQNTNSPSSITTSKGTDHD